MCTMCCCFSEQTDNPGETEKMCMSGGLKGMWWHDNWYIINCGYVSTIIIHVFQILVQFVCSHITLSDHEKWHKRNSYCSLLSVLPSVSFLLMTYTRLVSKLSCFFLFFFPLTAVATALSFFCFVDIHLLLD